MKLRNRALLLAACAVLLALPLPVGAQTPTTGVIAGSVVDETGEPLSDVQVSVTPAGGGFRRTVMTGRDGRFDVVLLSAGSYDVVVERLAYQPLRITGVPVRSLRTLRLTIPLQEATGAVAEAVTGSFVGTTGGSLPGVSDVFDDVALSMLQDRGRDAGELLRLSSRGELDLAIEGLPSTHTAVTIDGVPFRTATPAGFGDPGLTAFAYPLGGVREAELFGTPLHARTPSLGGGLLSITTAGGSSGGSGKALASIVPFGDDALPGGHQEMRGAFEAGTSLLNDSAHVQVFGSFVRTATDLDRWRTPGDEGALLALQDVIGGDSLVAGGTFEGDADRLQLGGRFDWAFGEDQTLAVTGHYAAASGALFTPGDGRFRPDAHDAADLAVIGSWAAQFSESVGATAQIGFARSSRDYGDVDRFAATGAGVLLSEGHVAVGVDPALPASADRMDVNAHGGVLLRSTNHLFQIGAGATFSTHEREYGPARRGLFAFGSATDLEAMTGVFIRSAGTATADFSEQQVFLYMQDRWAVAPGFDLLTGGRVFVQMLPTADIVPATEWLGFTGLDNTAAPDRLIGFGASAGFTWDVQQQHRWLVRGDFTVQTGEISADVLAEALTVDGRPTIERFVGDVSAFPAAPATQDARRLTLLDPDLEAPVTTRGSIGISAGIADNTALLLGGAVRQTTGLLRRSDVNLITLATAVDQHQRPVYGAPTQVGGLIVAEPGSSRRFADYDVVSALTADATSTYWGVSAGIERRAGGLFDVLASYTYSRTTDEPGHGADGLPPGITPDIGVADWADGTSDLDVPHRAVLAIRSRIPALERVRVGGTLRYESGRPFTPGFGPGMDMNADGIAGNDPAFVDPFIDGMDPLLAEWDCLRSAANRFVERNDCRAPARRALDLQLETDLVTRPDLAIAFRVEALDLLSEGGAWYDTALYTVDPEGSADLDATDGIVSVPLRVNADFGQPLVEGLNPTRVRLELQVRF